MKIYLLFYDIDNGARENWNTFYTPCEAFVSTNARNLRKAHIQSLNKSIEFHEIDLDVWDVTQVTSEPLGQDFDDEDGDDDDD